MDSSPRIEWIFTIRIEGGLMYILSALIFIILIVYFIKKRSIEETIIKDEIPEIIEEIQEKKKR